MSTSRVGFVPGTRTITFSTLLVGDEETMVNIHRSDLPPEAKQGDVLRLEVTIDYEATERRRVEVREKIERLKRRSENT